jgi:hypothetical protein
VSSNGKVSDVARQALHELHAAMRQGVALAEPERDRLVLAIVRALDVAERAEYEPAPIEHDAEPIGQLELSL